MNSLNTSSAYVGTLEAAGCRYRYIDLSAFPDAAHLPVALRVLLENVVRNAPDEEAAARAAASVIDAGLGRGAAREIGFMPARVLFQDFTGVPVFCDFAAMRDGALAAGADPALVNPEIPCALIIDHSVCADVVSCPAAASENARIEAARNAERFAFLKWSAESFDNVEIVPPGRGICHQLNVECLCKIAWTGEGAGEPWVYFDSLVGTDSHTTTANGLGVLGWGVGGIEAEAAALGQPISMLVPPVVGVRLTGSLAEGVSAMDAALVFAERLRAEGVVGQIVECFGAGAATLTGTQRATIANMTPEYGATATFFPPDERSLELLASFGRPEGERELARAYLDAQGLLRVDGEALAYSRIVEIDLSAIEPSLAGPSRPHDRVGVSGLRRRFRDALAAHGREPGIAAACRLGGETVELRHGAIGLAAITSCTTATDPAMMVAAGLVARRAVELGCRVPVWVKRVLAPGSHATAALLAAGGLGDALDKLGFAVCGFGCMSCIGNSGPLDAAIEEVSDEVELTSVLSGNRNFEGRISPSVVQNYLCAPALVVCYALAGTVDIDLTREPVCQGANGPVTLSDLLPSDAEVAAYLAEHLDPELFVHARADLFHGGEAWDRIASARSATYAWDPTSTYVRRPTFLEDVPDNERLRIAGARALVHLGDFVTTDHISPAGTIAPDSPAARYLREHGVADADFNSYGSRRGNHEVMMRGTFANIRLENALAGGKRGGWTLDPVQGSITSVFDAAQSARAAGIPLVVIAGRMYGSGSSRDWAAKGPALLGVRAVLAESFERIHRSNLVGMGILPLEFEEGANAAGLGLDGTEWIDIDLEASASTFPRRARVTARRDGAEPLVFPMRVRVDTPEEAAFFRRGGILPYVLERLIARPKDQE